MVFQFNGRRTAILGMFCLVASLAVLSACGSAASKESAPNSQTSVAAGPVQEVKVTMGDFYYDPGNITIQSGKVKFMLTNAGATAHRFSIKTGDTVKWTSKNVGAGRESVLEVDLPPGSYNLGCTLGDHEKRGAAGKLTVQ